MLTNRTALLVLITTLFSVNLLSQKRVVEYDLVVHDTIVDFSGKKKKAMAINGQIPGPTLHFVEGDSAVIRVHNHTKGETTLHWHGLIVPIEQDGVPYLTTAPTEPGESHTYTYPIVQNGTYFYHSHSGTQHQSGVYGAFIIDKKKDDPTMRAEDKLPTHTVLLSDWTDVNPDEVMRWLMTASDWGNIKKGSTQSYWEALRAGHLGTKVVNEWKRMSAMDISDVHYDKFLANGKEELSFDKYKAGDKVRLRVINGSASTNFWIRYSGGQMKVIASDGKDVVPVGVDRALIAVSETYDVVLTIPEEGKAFEFSATAEDRSGMAQVWLGSGEKHALEPLKTLKYFEGMKSMNAMMDMSGNMEPMDMSLQQMDMYENMYPEIEKASSHDHHNHGKQAEHSTHDAHTHHNHEMEQTATKAHNEHSEHSMHMKHDAHAGHDHHAHHNHAEHSEHHEHAMHKEHDAHQHAADSGIKTLNYAMLRSPTKTTLPADKPWRELRFELTGNMERYVWTMDNKTISETDKILIKKGENIRIVLYNNSMMRHPMHLHGHFFRVVNKHGDYSPLKTVLDIMPMETDTIEFHASEGNGDWFFHCHILYHMMAGMGKIFTYEDSEPNKQIADQAMGLKMVYDMDRMFYLTAKNEFLFNGNVGKFQYENTRWAIQGDWQLGYESRHGWEANVRAGRYLDRMQWLMPYVGAEWAYHKGSHGKNLFGQVQTNRRIYAVAGVRYTLPWFVVADARVNMYGKARVQLEREDIALTRRLRMDLMANTDKEYRAALNYIITPYIGLSASWGSAMRWGAGVKISY